MALTTNFDINSNFWSSNPLLKIPEVFAKLYEGDKSPQHSASSKLMWAVALFTDNNPDNKFKDLSETERKDLIIKDFLKEPKFKWGTIEHLIKEYDRLCMTPPKRQLRIFEIKLEDMNEYLKTLNYAENSEELVELMLKIPKLHEGLEKIREMINKEGDSGAVRGGAVESASEKGEI